MCIVSRSSITQSSRDDVHLVKDSIAFSDPGSVVAVEPDGVDLVDEGQSPVPVRDVAKLLQRRNRSGHRVNRLESHDL